MAVGDDAEKDTVPDDYVEDDPVRSENDATPLTAGGTSRTRVRRPRILVVAAVVAVLLLAASAPAAVRAYDNPTARALHGPAQNLAGLAAPGSLCQLQVTDHGATPDTGREEVQYAAVIHNPCADLAVDISIVVYPVARDGSEFGLSDEDRASDQQTIGALAPGTTTAIANSIYDAREGSQYPLTKVTDVSVHISNALWTSESHLRSMGRKGRTVYGLIDAHPHVRALRLLPDTGYQNEWEVAFTLSTDRTVADPGSTTVTVVARDRSGHIVSGAQDSQVRLNTPLMSLEDADTRYGSDNEIHRPMSLWLPGKPDHVTLSAYWLAPGPVSSRDAP